MQDIERLARSFWIDTGDPPTTQLVNRKELLCRRSSSSPGDNEVVRFLPAPGGAEALMAEVSQTFQDTDCIFCVFPHVHGPRVESALASHGFQMDAVFEGRIAKADGIVVQAVDGVQVRRVETLDDLRQFYQVRGLSSGRPFDYGPQSCGLFWRLQR